MKKYSHLYYLAFCTFIVSSNVYGTLMETDDEESHKKTKISSSSEIKKEVPSEKVQLLFGDKKSSTKLKSKTQNLKDFRADHKIPTSYRFVDNDAIITADDEEKFTVEDILKDEKISFQTENKALSFRTEGPSVDAKFLKPKAKLKTEVNYSTEEDFLQDSIVKFSTSSAIQPSTPYRKLSCIELQELVEALYLPQPINLIYDGDHSCVQSLSHSTHISLSSSPDLIQKKPELSYEFVRKATFLKEEHVKHTLGIMSTSLKTSFYGLGTHSRYKSSSEVKEEHHEKDIYIYVSHMYPKLQIILPESKIIVSPSYEDELKKVVDTKNRKLLIEFFKEYGYHVATSYTLGGSISAEDKRKFNIEKEESAYLSQLASDFAMSFFSTQIGYTSQTNQRDKAEKQEFSFNKKINGGDPNKQEDLQLWSASLCDYINWNIIKRDGLKPIYKFIKDEGLKKNCHTLLWFGIMKPLFDSIIVTTKKGDIEAGQGDAPAKITIINNTDLNFRFKGYNISYGKIVLEHEAPKTIEAGSIISFLASGRNGYGAIGDVVYTTEVDSILFDCQFSWSCPRATGATITGSSKISHPKMICEPPAAKTEPGNTNPSTLQFTLNNYLDIDGLQL